MYVQDFYECAHPPSPLIALLARFGFVNPRAAAKSGSVGRFGGQSLVERRDGKSGVDAGRSAAPGGSAGEVEGVDDGVEKSSGIVAPAGRVQSDRQFPVPVFVDLGDTVDQSGNLGSAADPVRCGVLDRDANPAAAVAEQR